VTKGLCNIFRTPSPQPEALASLAQSQSDDDNRDDETESIISDDETDWGENKTIYHELYSIVSNGSLDRLIRPILSPMKQVLVDRIMTEFWEIFNQEWSSNLTRCAGDTPTSSNSQGSGTGRQINTSSPEGKDKKRSRDDQEDELPDGNNGRTPKRPRWRCSLPKDSESVTKFACPYRKHDPRVYTISNYRNCALSHWESVARVK
jgi:hypothetical protein